jgi:RNA polymerase sigma factor FliA
MNAPHPVTEPSRLIEQCQGLVRSLASSIGRKLPPHIELEDLIEYGQVGLIEAARDFDPQRGGQFSTYAYYRIRGAIYDGLAKMCWFSRAQYRRLRYEQMANELLRTEREEENENAKSTAESDACWFRDVSRTLAVVYLATHRERESEEGQDSSALADSSVPEPSTILIGREMSRQINALIESLPSQEGTLIRATYFDGLSLQEAAHRLGISKAWASRLHAKVLQRLGKSLRLLEAPT